MYGIALETAAVVLLVVGTVLIHVTRPARSPQPVHVDVHVPQCDCHRPRPVWEAVTMLLPVVEQVTPTPPGYALPVDPWGDTERQTTPAESHPPMVDYFPMSGVR